MSNQRMGRQLSVIFASVVITLLSIAVVRGNPLSAVCADWNNGHHTSPGDDVWCQTGSNPWQMYGGYDFSSMEENDALNESTALCDDWDGGCSCDGVEFKQWAVDQENSPDCTYDISCIETSTYLTCDQAISGSMTCNCDYMNVCMPC